MYRDGQKSFLGREEEKEILMSAEADAFAEYILGNRMEEYEKAGRLCGQVHSCMDEIKRFANIKYGKLR